MIFEENIFNAGEGAFDCGCLRYYIDAVRIFVDQFLETSYLSFDATKSILYLFLKFKFHVYMIPLGGILRQSLNRACECGLATY